MVFVREEVVDFKKIQACPHRGKKVLHNINCKCTISGCTAHVYECEARDLNVSITKCQHKAVQACCIDCDPKFYDPQLVNISESNVESVQAESEESVPLDTDRAEE